MSAPSAAKASAVARPIPREPPVTRAIFPASFMQFSRAMGTVESRHQAYRPSRQPRFGSVSAIAMPATLAPAAISTAML